MSQLLSQNNVTAAPHTKLVLEPPTPNMDPQTRATWFYVREFNRMRERLAMQDLHPGCIVRFYSSSDGIVVLVDDTHGSITCELLSPADLAQLAEGVPAKNVYEALKTRGF
jgi:hypothetical protein